MKPKDFSSIIMLVPITAIVALASTIGAIVFHSLSYESLLLVFSLIAFFSWAGLLVEFGLMYQSIVYRWFTKDRSVFAAVWFVVSIFLAIMLTPNHGWSWQTFVVPVIIFIPLFFIPYYIGIRYGKRLKKTSSQAEQARLAEQERQAEKERLAEQERQIEASIAKTTLDPKMSEQSEREHYDSLVNQLSPELVKTLPEKLQSNNALFLLVLFRENGFLNQDFKPIITNEVNEIHQSLYAFVADCLSAALVINNRKWAVFSEFWGINNGAQALQSYKATNKKAPTQHTKTIGTIFRKATRLRPEFDDIDDLKPILRY